ncbi:LamG-like jellyroll fold domain-containing protein [Gimesia algae]|uniref:LamG-like jellyroll fold domain-containing protein n=1 Tax=Gimesia algae TaxID=2527971 RepID=A0A517V6G4_9PLAN|nr:LamG-like jellyroll fold domain-containing protein [Gimesia algae]QDT88588.1 hypothetical protein Pan161_02060 [Gimesia algae]
MNRPCFIVLLLICSALQVAGNATLSAETITQNWQADYSGSDTNGPTVIGHWQFKQGAETVDSGRLGLTGTLDGAVPATAGKFGGGLESFPGWPIDDKHHALMITDHPELSPPGAFTVEMWIKPKAQLREASLTYLIDKKYASKHDYQWLLSPPNPAGRRRMNVVLGFGEETETFVTDFLSFEQDVWQHVAFSYDGAGTVRFYQNGSSVGNVTRPGRHGIAAGKLPLSIGDRIGSNYGGFPGFIDEVRISSGALEFNPLTISLTVDRSVWRRFESSPKIQVTVRNQQQTSLGGAKLRLLGPGWMEREIDLPELPAEGKYTEQVSFDTSLRPDDYILLGQVSVGGDYPMSREESLLLKLVPRRVPGRMPVLMWGIGSPGEFEKELPRLQDLGFNHCLGFSTSPQKVWDAGKPVPTDGPATINAVRGMLDSALANDFDIAASLYAGHFLKARKELSRVDRNGQPYQRHDCNASLPGLQEFSENYGRSVGEMYGDHPALAAALINSEVRDSTHVSFSKSDFARYREFSGEEIPAEVTDKIGPRWHTIPDFPKNRVLPDDDRLLKFYRWFWTVGDGWNPLHTALHRGLKADGRDRIWTFYDPAIRAPSIGGSGGEVDVISQWTYTEPSALRVGYFCDEVFAMAAASDKPQDVMKMTQLFWYRSSSAPKKTGKEFIASPFDDHDPDAAYISIAPTHLRSAFWSKIARPVTGLMYHGWSSLVPTDGTHAYKYTQPDLQTEFKRLHREILEPLGPTLLKVPDRQADVAYLDSFTSQIFAGRGSYGYYHDEAYLTLLHAQLQPEVIFEETLLKKGLDQYKLLVLADCDVLTRSVVEKILAFQKRGGIVIGDPNLTPAIKADIVLPKFVRSKRTQEDQKTILQHAAQLKSALAGRYEWYSQSTTPEIVTRTRSAGISDYVFVVNDRREFGTYVGQHGLVMEDGLPAEGKLTLLRDGGHVYDLQANREIPAQNAEHKVSWPVQLGPCEGRVFLVTPTPIAAVKITGAQSTPAGKPLELLVSVLDSKSKTIPAVIPLEVKITDPAGRVAEFSGYYGAEQGQLPLKLDIASNDRPGMWKVHVRELASGQTGVFYFRVQNTAEINAK